MYPRIFITAKIHRGKTRLLQSLVTRLQKLGLEIGGVLSLRIKDGYEAMDVASEQRVLFMSRNPEEIPDIIDRIGPFHISQKGMQFALEQIKQSLSRDKITVIDEIGKLELKHHRGYWPVLELALQSSNLVVFSIRDRNLEEFLQHPQLKRSDVIKEIINVDQRKDDIEQLSEEVSKRILSYFSSSS